MVEGPGATRNADKTQQLVGWRVETAVKKCQDLSELRGAVLNEAFCVGKEVFLCFDKDHSVLRLHFGMNGSLCVRTQSSKVDPWKAKDTTLSLYFVNDEEKVLVLESYGSTICETTYRVAASKRERMQHLDICGEDFLIDQVILAVKTRPDILVSDCLLDQTKVPGVGNIIKIEGLHMAGIHPKRLVSSLSDSEIKNLLENCRVYATEWYKNGRAPPKRVYNLTNCGSCKKPSVRMVKIGNDLRRVTFWCESCQPFSSSKIWTLNRPSEANKKVQVGTDRYPNNKSCCPQHGERPVVLRRVRKADSMNRLRLFYTCKHRGCPYFEWADGHLPLCRCKKKSLLLISKTERTGGRWFLACPKSRCGHFAWATTSQIIAFGPQLTPLR